MNESLISGRYAKALLAYAVDTGEEQALYELMRQGERTCTAMPKLLLTLASPVVTPAEKEQLILGIAGNGVPKSYAGLARLAVANHRETMIADIARAYMRLYRQQHNIRVVTLSSVKELAEADYARIAREVQERTHGTVEFDIRIDRELTGGFVLQIDDMRLDASIKGQLERIKRRLTRQVRALV